MRTTLKMPKVGDAANEVVVLEILVKPGDRIEEGQTLFLVETDKAQIEVPSPAAGTVAELLVKIDDEVATGTPTLVLNLG